MKAIVGSYLDIQAQLAGDKTRRRSSRRRRRSASRPRAWAPAGDAIVKAAKAIEDAADLKAAREAFGALSDAVIAAGNAEGWKDMPDVQVAYCPMVKKSWVQKDDAIRNPYYGRRCSPAASFRKKTRVRSGVQRSRASARSMIAAPATGPGTSTRNAHRQPMADGDRRQQPHADHRQQEPRAGLKRQRRADVRASG